VRLELAASDSGDHPGEAGVARAQMSFRAAEGGSGVGFRHWVLAQRPLRHQFEPRAEPAAVACRGIALDGHESVSRPDAQAKGL
jgi:hypothetical protein